MAPASGLRSKRSLNQLETTMPFIKSKKPTHNIKTLKKFIKNSIKKDKLYFIYWKEGSGEQHVIQIYRIKKIRF